MLPLRGNGVTEIRGFRCGSSLGSILLTWALVLSGVGLLPLRAWAQTDTIVILETPATAAAAVRVKAELAPLGWPVLIVKGTGRTLADWARDYQSVAVLRIVSGGRGVELWIPARDRHDAPVREVVQPEDANGDVLALRAVEVLRARLLKLGKRPPRVTTAPAPPPEAEEPSSPLPVLEPAASKKASDLASNHACPGPACGPRAWFEAGPSWTLWGASRATTGTLRLGLSLRTFSRVELGLFILPPLTTSAFLTDAGRVVVRPGVIGLWAGWAAGSPQGRFSVSVGGGVGALGLWVGAEPHRNYVAHSDFWVTFAPFLRIAPGVNLSRRTRLRLEGLFGVVTPVPVIAAAGQEAAMWGRLFSTVTLQVEVGLGAQSGQ